MIQLKVGQVFKNYKAICEWLNVEPAKKGATNTRNSHIKEFERYCKFHKEGQNFIIDEVYDIPLKKQDGRINNKNNKRNSIYGNLFDILLIDTLLNTIFITDYEDKIYLTSRVLFTNEKFLDMFNGEVWSYIYKYDNNKLIKMFETHGIGIINCYFENLNTILKNMFVRGLKNLQKHNIISFKHCYLIDINDIDTKMLRFYNDDKKIIRLKEIENNILADMGKTKYSITKNKMLNNQFNKKVYDIINAEQLFGVNIKRYFTSYEITVKDDSYFNDYYNDEYLDNENFNKEKTIIELSRRIIIQLHKSINNKKIDNKNVYDKIKWKRDVLNIDKKIFKYEVIDTENEDYNTYYYCYEDYLDAI